MHPNPAFRHDDQNLLESMIDQIGFGMVFAATPDGPRVAHTPLLSTGNGTVRFHLARGNALVRHLDGGTGLVVVNGPDGYVSARWYEDDQQVPTWNYVALELEGPVRRLDEVGLVDILEGLTQRHEARIVAGQPWTMDKLTADTQRKLLGAIVGFELEVRAWRPTFKLSQNKSTEERQRLADSIEAEGSPAIAQLMRTLIP